jgi:small nuclear ribonucleoprotein D3
MVIPDMLKNAPMFKRLDARIKVSFGFEVIRFFYIVHCFNFSDLCFLNFLKGKGAALGVGRGRAVAMRAKVIFFCIWCVHNSILFGQ